LPFHVAAGDEALMPELILGSRDAGVHGIYGPESNIVECAADVLRLLGHNMPPVGE
jgi:methylmalonyl-CoA mutase cobalamin-binding subunit